jgi:hypothetical protein
MGSNSIVARWTDKRTGREESADVLNPGDYWGSAFLVYNQDCFDPPIWIVEADHAQDAQEEFLEHDQAVNCCMVQPEDIADHDDNDGRLTWNSQGAFDTEALMVDDAPSDLRYFGDHLPPWGIKPAEYGEWIESLESGKEDAAKNWGYDPRYKDRIAYSMGFLSVGSRYRRADRAARLYLRLAGLPV